MRSTAKKTFYFHADAHGLGGSIEAPIKKPIPSQAALSLPSVGGHVTSRTEAFNFEEIVSCRSAYTRILGRQQGDDGPGTVLVTSVVEGLNILEVVTVERLVAQISIDRPTDGGYPVVSFTGSHFDGLKIGGCDVSPNLNASLQEGGGGAKTPPDPIVYPLFQKTGQLQTAKLVKDVHSAADGDSFQWLVDRYGWMASGGGSAKDGLALCSLVDGIEPAVAGKSIPCRSFGHVLEVAEFGRIFLGELLVLPSSVRLSMVRAELGCGTSGGTSGGGVGVGIHTIPP